MQGLTRITLGLTFVTSGSTILDTKVVSSLPDTSRDLESHIRASGASTWLIQKIHTSSIWQSIQKRILFNKF